MGWKESDLVSLRADSPPFTAPWVNLHSPGDSVILGVPLPPFFCRGTRLSVLRRQLRLLDQFHESHSSDKTLSRIEAWP